MQMDQVAKPARGHYEARERRTARAQPPEMGARVAGLHFQAASAQSRYIC